MLDVDICKKISDKIILFMQVMILKAGHLQEKFIVSDKTTHISDGLTLLFILIMIEKLLALLQEESQPLFLLAGYLFGVQDLVCTVDISRIKQRIGVNLSLQIIIALGVTELDRSVVV